MRQPGQYPRPAHYSPGNLVNAPGSQGQRAPEESQGAGNELKEAYDIHFEATMKRTEKQYKLAKHGRLLTDLLDDQQAGPCNPCRPFEHGEQALKILHAAQEELFKCAQKNENISSEDESEV